MSSAFYHDTQPILLGPPTLTYDTPAYPGLHGFTGTAALQYPTSSMPAEHLSTHSKEPIFATPTSAMAPLVPAEQCIACYPRRDFPDYHYSIGPGMVTVRSPDIERYLVALARKYSMESSSTRCAVGTRRARSYCGDHTRDLWIQSATVRWVCCILAEGDIYA